MERTSPEYLTMVRDRAKELSLERALAVADKLMGDNGEVFGQLALKGADFEAYFIDLTQRPYMLPDGSTFTLNLLDHLEVINPELTQQLRREFDRRIARTF